MEHLLTLQVETISDDNGAREQRGHPGGAVDGRLQAPPGGVQDCVGNGPLLQVHVLGDGVDDDAALWSTVTTESSK